MADDFTAPTVMMNGNQLTVPCLTCGKGTFLYLSCCKCVGTCGDCMHISQDMHKCLSLSLAEKLQQRGCDGITLMLGPMRIEAMRTASVNLDVLMTGLGNKFDSEMALGHKFDFSPERSTCFYLVYHVPTMYVNRVVRAIYGNVVLVRGEWRGVTVPGTTLEIVKICDTFGSTFSLLQNREDFLRDNYVMMSVEEVKDQMQREASFIW